MTYLKTLLFALFLVFTNHVVAESVSADNRLTGYWVRDGILLHIYTSDRNLHAVITALNHDTYREGESDKWPEGSLRRDENNPNPSLRDRPVIGIDMLHNFRKRNKIWKGRIYDPESGKSYSAQIRIDKKTGDLRMRAFIGVSLLGRTMSFSPAHQCEAENLYLIKKAGQEICDG